MTERELQEAVLEAAKLGGWLAYHTFDSRRSTGGFPDLVLVRGRRVLFVELKSEKGKLTEAQGEWLAALSQGLPEVAVWRPADLDRVYGMLLKRDR